MITREEFEKLLKNKNALDLFSVFNKTDLVELFGHDVAEMYGYDQSNPHHCYDLWNHTLHTVDSISPDGIDENDFLTLRIVAFFHDIGKPLCCKIKPDGKKSFHGHPQKSVVLARPILKEIGYDKNEIDRICLFIGHHDDFINFANKLPERLKQDIFLREPSKIAVKEVLIKNMFDFKKMGYDVFEIQYITSFLATGKSRKFTHSGLPIEADVDMKEVLKKMQEKKYRIKDVPDIDDYRLLMRLCLGDANAQSDVCMANGIDYSKQSKKNTLKKISEILERPLNFTFIKEMDGKEGER